MELYDARKLYASIYTAAIAVREPVGSAELIAREVVASIEIWLAKKHEVTSNDIRRIAHTCLKDINDSAAYQYLHHRTVW